MLADVARREDCERVAATADERHGGIDVLCANAGIFPAHTLAEMTDADIDEVFGTNLKGCILTVQACMPALARSGHGRVILTSSITGPITGFRVGRTTGPARPASSASCERRRSSTRRAASPSTPCSRATFATEGLDELGEDYEAAMTASIPLKRLGTVEDIGNAALFLATDEAAYITGQAIVVDGGQVLPESLAAMEDV